MFNKTYNLVTTDGRDEGKVLVDTFIFHTFFMMTMFNQINSRVVDKDDMNVCKTICNNPIFWFIWIAEMVIEHMLIIWSGTTVTGGKILGMAPLPFEVMIISSLIGAFSIVIHVVQVKIPLPLFEKLDEKIGIDSEKGAQMV